MPTSPEPRWAAPVLFATAADNLLPAVRRRRHEPVAMRPGWLLGSGPSSPSSWP